MLLQFHRTLVLNHQIWSIHVGIPFEGATHEVRVCKEDPLRWLAALWWSFRKDLCQWLCSKTPMYPWSVFSKQPPSKVGLGNSWSVMVPTPSDIGNIRTGKRRYWTIDKLYHVRLGEFPGFYSSGQNLWKFSMFLPVNLSVSPLSLGPITEKKTI